jgi:ribonucleoside-triphosphate reductase
MVEEKDKQIPCEVYSRVVGYLRPVQSWNDAKQAEFYERRMFDEAVGEEEKEELCQQSDSD